MEHEVLLKHAEREPDCPSCSDSIQHAARVNRAAIAAAGLEICVRRCARAQNFVANESPGLAAMVEAPCESSWVGAAMVEAPCESSWVRAAPVEAPNRSSCPPANINLHSCRRPLDRHCIALV